MIGWRIAGKFVRKLNELSSNIPVGHYPDCEKHFIANCGSYS
jgi:hypothetical protein